MADFSAVVELSALDGTNGFQISGAAAGYQSGWSVASAGDINGDGIDDLVVGSVRADPNGVANAGSTYVIFGRDTASQGDFLADINLSTLDGSNGFRINGEAVNDYSGWAVASAGDINGDGIDDLILSAPEADPNGSESGASYVLFGKDTAVDGGFGAAFSLSSLDGTNGFKVIGPGGGERVARSVASAGDVNGDGIDDIVLGTIFGSGSTGATYVVFGTDEGFDGTLNVANLTGTNGFKINGEAFPDQSGRSVSSGDVNGDGVSDLIIGAADSASNGSRSGSSYVVFGRDTAVDGDFNASMSLSDLTGPNGFQITGAAGGDYSGWSVSSAGDVNGDGFDDVIVGAKYADGEANNAGASFVVFGRASFGANVNLADLDGATGFRINGQVAHDNAGFVVSGAGDVNGDGYADVMVGSRSADPNGSDSGATWVVFGKPGAFAPVVNLSGLDGANGFKIAGELMNDRAGAHVSAAGDINGDGVDDLTIGAYRASPNGAISGAAYVVFGIQADLSKVGTAADETLNGAGADDSLAGMAGKDRLNGLAGDDALDGGDGNDLLYGGDGADDLLGGLGGDTLFGDAGGDELSGGDGADKLYGGVGADLLNGGTGNDRMDGESDIDTLNGGAGNDYLDGGLGADIMSGGTENDVYIVDDADDQTIELAGGGYDIVRTTLSWTLASEVESLDLQAATDVDGTGNSGVNNLQGNAGANTLSGLAGVDTINGNDGDDVIVGGLNNDLLRGGTGADTFVVLQESVNTATLETDTVYDFFTAEGDRLDLSAIDANSLIGGEQDFVLVSSFSNAGGEMTLTFSGGQTTIRLDVDGDKAADYQIRINGDVTGDSGGWLL